MKVSITRNQTMLLMSVEDEQIDSTNKVFFEDILFEYAKKKNYLINKAKVFNSRDHHSAQIAICYRLDSSSSHFEII